MTYLIVSDTHGRRDRLEEVVRRNPGADGLLFLGDGLRDTGEVRTMFAGRTWEAVKGNCDGFFLNSSGISGVTEELFLTLGEYHILMMHGHIHGVKGDPEWAVRYASERGADVLLYGHTHIAQENYYSAGTCLSDGYCLPRALYTFNPGSLGEPRCGKPSYGVMEIRRGGILLSHGTL